MPSLPSPRVPRRAVSSSLSFDHMVGQSVWTSCLTVLSLAREWAMAWHLGTMVRHLAAGDLTPWPGREPQTCSRLPAGPEECNASFGPGTVWPDGGPTFYWSPSILIRNTPPPGSSRLSFAPSAPCSQAGAASAVQQTSGILLLKPCLSPAAGLTAARQCAIFRVSQRTMSLAVAVPGIVRIVLRRAAGSARHWSRYIAPRASGRQEQYPDRIRGDTGDTSERDQAIHSTRCPSSAACGAVHQVRHLVGVPVVSYAVLGRATRGSDLLRARVRCLGDRDRVRRALRGRRGSVADHRSEHGLSEDARVPWRRRRPRGARHVWRVRMALTSSKRGGGDRTQWAGPAWLVRLTHGLCGHRDPLSHAQLRAMPLHGGSAPTLTGSGSQSRRVNG